MPSPRRSGCTAIKSRFQVPDVMASGAQYATATGEPSSCVSQNSDCSVSFLSERNMPSKNSEGNSSTVSMMPFKAGRSLVSDDLILDFSMFFTRKFGQQKACSLNLVIQAQALFDVSPLGNASTGGGEPEHENSEL